MSQKRYKVIISDRAWNQIGIHVRFLSQTNRSAAKRARQRLTNAIELLAEMPERYPLLDNELLLLGREYRRMYVENWYIVLYRIVGNTVSVEWSIDARQDYDWLIQS